MTLEELKEFLSNLTVIEACKLAVDLEDAWGVLRPGKVREYRYATAYGAPMPPSWNRMTQSFTSEYDTIAYYLVNPGTNALYLMQQLRKHLGWSLTQVKEALNNPRCLLLETDIQRKAQALIDDLKVFGAEVIAEAQ